MGSNTRHGRQRVTVTRLGSSHFLTQIDSVQKLQTGFSFGARSRQVRCKREDLPTATSMEFRRAKLQPQRKSRTLRRIAAMRSQRSSSSSLSRSTLEQGHRSWEWKVCRFWLKVGPAKVFPCWPPTRESSCRGACWPPTRKSHGRGGF